MRCAVCGADNSELALRCAACGAYVRDRVPALNLFATLWAVIESPREAFLRVARSEQKNYAVGIFGATGPLFLAGAAAAAGAGDTDLHFGLLFLGVFLAGPPLGMLLWTAATYVLRLLLPEGALPKARFRALMPLVAYALFPAALSALVLLPVQLGIFGRYLFSANPYPWMLQPAAFWILLGLEGAFLLWSAALLVRAPGVYGIGPARAAAGVLPVLAGVAALVFFCGKLLGGVLP